MKKRILAIMMVAMMLSFGACGDSGSEKWIVTGIVAGSMKTTQADLEKMGFDGTEYLELKEDGTFEWRCFDAEATGSWTNGEDKNYELTIDGQDVIKVKVKGSKAVFTDNEGTIYTLKKQGE